MPTVEDLLESEDNHCGTVYYKANEQYYIHIGLRLLYEDNYVFVQLKIKNT